MYDASPTLKQRWIILIIVQTCFACRLQKHEPETIDSVGTTIAADNEKVKYELRDLKSRYDDLKKQ